MPDLTNILINYIDNDKTSLPVYVTVKDNTKLRTKGLNKIMFLNHLSPFVTKCFNSLAGILVTISGKEEQHIISFISLEMYFSYNGFGKRE